MSIDIDRIYALVAQRPGIRTVEIADEIDCDADQVKPRLSGDIAAGNIAVRPISAPNGRTVDAFEFTAEFMASPFYGLIAARAGLDSALRDLSQAVSPASPEAVPPAPKRRGKREKLSQGLQYPQPRAPIVAPPPSYPERAIAFLRAAGGRAGNEALREALSLGRGTSPSSYLRAAIADGRLVRDGRDWMIGPNVDVMPRYAPGKTAARAIPAPPSAAAPAPRAFRCARWSDGVLELQRDGVTIAMLEQAEQTALIAMLAVTV
ncbi:hypothetical protein [Duganella sp. LjRoot269]|uniref:hypothetical protein n=1 Tax=Duganella sp. LjRoot269 TaxID=3342305 RepID=UPI003ED105E0